MADHGSDSDEAPIDEDATVSLRPVVEAPKSLVGRVIASKYVVREVLGRGGMGVVVRAHHLALDQPVALKFLLGVTPAASARFQREARIAFQLSGEHIARVFDVGTLEDGTPYLVMQLVQGETLAELLIREGKMSARTAIELVLQACVGLAEAHRAGIVHRDLKPSNLMLTTRADGTPLVKVLDFGIAKIVGGEDAAPALGSADTIAGTPVADTVSRVRPAAPTTRGTAVVGSPFYMSPEQIERPAEVDARSDLWALGVVLHELVSGKMPFGEVSVAGVAVAITEGIPTLAFGDDETGRALDAVVRKCLARDPAGRFQDVAEFAAALAAIADTSTTRALAARAARVLARAHSAGHDRATSVDPKASASKRSARSISRSMRWGGAAAVLLVTLIVVWVATRDRAVTTSARPTTSPASTAISPSSESPMASASTASSVSPPPSVSTPPSVSPRACPPDMVFVPAGAFTMGLPKGAGHDRASPERQVQLSAYCIDRTEVTVDAYERCVEAPGSGCTPAKTTAQFRADPPTKPIAIDECNAGVVERGGHPINCVDWDQANSYCKWVTAGRGRLPTEAQWERAARGTDGRKYPWGDGAPSVDLVNGSDEEYAKWREGRGLDAPKTSYPGSDGWAATAPAGSFPKGVSPVGALDMAGNVWEWTADYYSRYDKTARSDPYRATRDPEVEDDAHTIRGGGWSDDVDQVTHRRGWRTRIGYPDLGFRCASPGD